MAMAPQKAAHIAGERPDIGTLAAFGLENRMIRVRDLDQGEGMNLDRAGLQLDRLDIARDGETVELEARPVEIHALTLVEVPDPDHAIFEAECGKGTYVRALARDMGRLLGCHGHVSALRRTRVGPFTENSMISLEHLEGLCHSRPWRG